MLKLLSLLTLGIFAFALIGAVPAQARVYVGVGVGYGGYGYPGYYPGYYYSPSYYPPAYYPPPVVYAPPPVVYAPQPRVVYTAPSAMPADQSSPTYTDNYGRTCRQYSSPTSNGTACLEPDGTWRVTP